MSAYLFPAEAGNTPKGKGGTFPPDEAEAGAEHQAVAEDGPHDQGGQGQQGRSVRPGRVGAGARGGHREHVDLAAVWKCRLRWAQRPHHQA